MTQAVPANVVTVLEKMSDTDRKLFLALLARLEKAGSDVAKLSDADRQLMLDLGERNRELFALMNTESSAPKTVRYSESEITTAILKSQFYLYVREALFQEWCVRGGSIEDAVLHAFEQKWLPDALRDEEACTKIFKQYQREIEQFNAFRREVQEEDAIVTDKKMAVGLAWFTTLYKLKMLIGQGVDLTEV